MEWYLSEVTFDLGLLEAGVLHLKLRTVDSEGLCVYEMQYVIQEVAYITLCKYT